MGDSLASMFNVPANFTVTIDVSDYKPDGETLSCVKEVDINLAYNFANDSRNIRIQRLKIKRIIRRLIDYEVRKRRYLNGTGHIYCCSYSGNKYYGTFEFIFLY